MAACIRYISSDLVESRSLLARIPDRSLLSLLMSDPALQRLRSSPLPPPPPLYPRLNPDSDADNDIVEVNDSCVLKYEFEDDMNNECREQPNPFEKAYGLLAGDRSIPVYFKCNCRGISLATYVYSTTGQVCQQ
mgnify:CR=1 FL=1